MNEIDFNDIGKFVRKLIVRSSVFVKRGPAIPSPRHYKFGPS